jgi:ABC-type sugar transport system substrate-binding protein
MRTMIRVLAVAALLAGAAACGSSDDEGSAVDASDWTGSAQFKTGTVGILNVLGSSEAQQHWQETAVAAVKEIGWEQTVIDGKGDPAVEGQAINSFVQQGVDGIIIIGGVAPQTIAAQLRQAKDADIPVVSTGVSSPNDDGSLDGVFAPPDAQFGVVLAEYLNEKLPDGAPYVALDLTAAEGAQAPNDAAKPILEKGGHALAGAVDLDLAGDLASQASKAAGDLTAAHPDAKLLFGCCDFTAAMTDPVLKQAGRDDVIQSVRYDNASTQQLIRDGSNVVTCAVNADAGVLMAIREIVDHTSQGTEIDASAPDSLWEFKVVDATNLPAEGEYTFDPQAQIDEWVATMQNDYKR